MILQCSKNGTVTLRNLGYEQHYVYQNRFRHKFYEPRSIQQRFEATLSTCHKHIVLQNVMRVMIIAEDSLKAAGLPRDLRSPRLSIHCTLNKREQL
jgi:hypothetical protein